MAQRITITECQKAFEILCDEIGQTHTTAKEAHKNKGAWFLDYHAGYGGVCVSCVIPGGSAQSRPFGTYTRMKPEDFYNTIGLMRELAD